MRAHQIDSNGVIINTVRVNSLSDLPNLIDASIGGGIGDIVQNGNLVQQPTSVPPVLTVQDFADAVQKHLDDTAKSRGYAGILSAVSYVGDADPVFNAEGTALKAWRSAVWNACHVKLAEVNAGGVPPTIPELIAILPAVVW
jgi:hypothetical protein